VTLARSAKSGLSTSEDMDNRFIYQALQSELFSQARLLRKQSRKKFRICLSYTTTFCATRNIVEGGYDPNRSHCLRRHHRL
jgi:hypothetical protein